MGRAVCSARLVIGNAIRTRLERRADNGCSEPGHSQPRSTSIIREKRRNERSWFHSPCMPRIYSTVTSCSTWYRHCPYPSLSSPSLSPCLPACPLEQADSEAKWKSIDGVATARKWTVCNSAACRGPPSSAHVARASSHVTATIGRPKTATRRRSACYFPFPGSQRLPRSLSNRNLIIHGHA